MSKKIFKFGVLVKSSLFYLVFLVPLASALEWKMPVAGQKNSMHGELALEFSKQVAQATENRVKLTVYSSGSLYKDGQIFGAVKNNLVPIGSRLLSALAHENQLFQLDALPFLAKNYTQAFNLYKASKEELEKTLRVKGVKLLYAVPWPAQGFYSTVKIDSLEDMKGLKFRPYSKLTLQFGEHLGMQEVIFPLKDLKKRLKKKPFIDVLFGSALSAQNHGLVKNFPYWYDLKGWLPKEMVVVNLQSWKKLLDKDKNNILNVAMNIERLGWLKSKEEGEKAKQYLIASGVAVESPSYEFTKNVEQVAWLVIRRWLDESGDRGRYILERYMKL